VCLRDRIYGADWTEPNAASGRACRLRGLARVVSAFRTSSINTRVLTVGFPALLLSAGGPHKTDLSVYRGFRIGTSVADVAKRAGMNEADAKKCGYGSTIGN
jgi:hypothetical protein